jgi:acyl dehydratase
MSPFDPDRLLRREFAPIEQTYDETRAILYALTVGYGRDPLDTRELPFVYQQAQRAAPTLALVVGYPGFWMMEPDTGIDWRSVLHAGQTLELHDEMPTAATVVGQVRVTEVVDKGPSVGALITSQRTLVEKGSGRKLATATQVYLARGNGGFGGAAAVRKASPRRPQGAPALVDEYSTAPNAALLYRLCGDMNPLHADPAVAAAVGFEQPILHGLCSYGIAARALVKTVCRHEPARLRRMDARFTAPAYPGETIRTEIWPDGNPTLFRVVAAERGQVILDNGIADTA